MQPVLFRTAVTTIFFLCVICLSAQDNAITALRKIQHSYNGGKAIRFTGSMKMYAKNQPSRIIDQLQSSYILKNKNFRCSIGPVSMLLNNDYYISVDNSGKLIMLGRRKDLPVMAGNPVLNLGQLEKWLGEKKIQATVSVNTVNTVLQLTDMEAVSGFNAYSIEFNTINGYMKKVVMESVASNEPGKTTVLEINYSEPLPATNTSFSEKPFFSVVGNSIQLSAAYRGYQLINQL